MVVLNEATQSHVLAHETQGRFELWPLVAIDRLVVGVKTDLAFDVPF